MKVITSTSVEVLVGAQQELVGAPTDGQKG